MQPDFEPSGWPTGLFVNKSNARKSENHQVRINPTIPSQGPPSRTWAPTTWRTPASTSSAVPSTPPSSPAPAPRLAPAPGTATPWRGSWSTPSSRGSSCGACARACAGRSTPTRNTGKIPSQSNQPSYMSVHRSMEMSN